MDAGYRFAGRFQLESQAALGGMGTVYKATDLQRDVPVAVKILRPATRSDVERFRREAALLARLNHPRIVRYVDHGTTPDGREYLVMEWLEGRTLADVLQARGLSIREAVTCAISVAEGLQGLHDAGVVHRDVKPRNLMLPMDGFEAKILDLGVARQKAQEGLTQAGYTVGSYGYIAPEHARGDRELDGRSDLFALGCILYECLTGDAPFAGSAALSVRTKLLLWEPPPVLSFNPDVSTALNELVGSLLAKEPARRPASAREVVDRLRALEEREGFARKQAPRGKREVTGTALVRQGEADAPVFLLFIGAEDAEASMRVDVQERLALLPDAKRFELVGDGWLVITFSAEGTPESVAALTAKTALDLRSLFPEEPMVVIGPEATGGAPDVERMIERGVALCANEARLVLLRDLKGSLGDGAIRLDDATAAVLGGRFKMRPGDTGVYLLGAELPSEG